MTAPVAHAKQTHNPLADARTAAYTVGHTFTRITGLCRKPENIRICRGRRSILRSEYYGNMPSFRLLIRWPRVRVSPPPLDHSVESGISPEPRKPHRAPQRTPQATEMGGIGRVITIGALAILFALIYLAGGPEPSHASTRNRVLIICSVWPDAYEDAAIRVARCESRLDPRARNGQYRGLFQVNAALRRDYRGFGRGGWAQARHALRVFNAAGKTWQPWECKP